MAIVLAEAEPKTLSHCGAVDSKKIMLINVIIMPHSIDDINCLPVVRSGH